MASRYWQARNARARALGYQNYYDYRAHGYGRTPPGAPRAKGPELRRLRGHAGPEDFRSLVRRGRVEMVIVDATDRDRKTGKFRRARLDVTLDDGGQQDFWLRGSQLTPDKAKQLGQFLIDHNITIFDRYAILLDEPAYIPEIEIEEAA